jgi:hypothetical protein
MPRWWPGSSDEGDEGKYADVGRNVGGRPTGSGTMQEMVRDILRSADPIQGKRVKDIAEEVGVRRDGPAAQFSGRRKNQLQSHVNTILRGMRDRGEAEQLKKGRGSSPSSWGILEGPRGAPKRKGWTGGHAGAGEGDPAKRKPYKSRRTGDPSTWGDQDKPKPKPDKRPWYEKEADRAKERARRRDEPDRRPWYEKQADKAKQTKQKGKGPDDDSGGGVGVFRGPTSPKKPDGGGGGKSSGGGKGIFKGV